MALAVKAMIANGDWGMAVQQIDAVLAGSGTNGTDGTDGTNGFFNERSSGFVLLADGSMRAPLSQRRTVGDSAWFGLALLDALRLTGNERFLTRAREITDWFERELKASGPLQGYFGGYDDAGNDPL